jgi:hypothetical protein
MRQQSQQNTTDRRFRRRRLVLLLVIGFAVAAWGPRAATVLTDGWCSSCRVLEQQRRIREMQQRIEALEAQVEYARTAEGRDVEAKRRFGVGPDDEVGIMIDSATNSSQSQGPQSVAARLESWLQNAGSRFLDRGRDFWLIIAYGVGLHDVTTCVVVPEVADYTGAGQGDINAGPDATGDSRGADGEAIGDEIRS